ncbi:FkbM family methyltransferase [Methanobacterium oryzae]|uniref:FkbM family methyltransferase n=1 Tax=Methanobacterium oryzae TaxID=69540 RepID=UPI003D19D805
MINKNGLIKSFLFPIVFYSKNLSFNFGRQRMTLWGERIIRKHYNGELITDSKDGRTFIFNFPRDYGAETVYLLGEYETETSNIFKKIIKKDDIIFDLGANYGWYTTLFAKLAYQGYCHAFEPIEWIFNSLKRNCRINHLDNVFLNQLAVGDSIKEVEMFVFDELPHGHSSISNYASNEYISSKSQMITLNNYISTNDIDKIDLIKCDIEGSELKMLEGATDLFELKKPPIWIFEMNKETSDALGFSPSAILEFLMQFYEYKFFSVENGWGKIKEMNDIYDYKDGDNVFCTVPKFHKSII